MGFTALAAVFVYCFYTKLRQLISRKKCCKATIISKTKQKYDKQQVYSANNRIANTRALTGMQNVISVELENKKKLDFIVDEHTYQRLTEDEKGKLTFKGTKWIQFEPDEYANTASE